MLRSVFQFFNQRRINNAGPVFLYHHVGFDGSEKFGNIHNVNASVFRKQIQKISQKFKVVFADELLSAVRQGEDVRGMAAITFDDGTLSSVHHAIPILLEFQTPATFFLNSSFLSDGEFWRDNVNAIMEAQLQNQFLEFAGEECRGVSVKRFYWDTKDITLVDQTRLVPLLKKFVQSQGLLKGRYKMYASVADLHQIDSPLIQFGNHSQHHLILAGLSYEDQFAEIKATKDVIESHFSESRISKIFSIPFGNRGTYDHNTMAALLKNGYEFALSSESNLYFKKNISHFFEFDGVALYNRFMPKNSSHNLF